MVSNAFAKSIGLGGSKAIRSNSIAQGSGDHAAQKTGTQGSQAPGPRFKGKAPENIVGKMQGGADGKVCLKPIPSSK